MTRLALLAIMVGLSTSAAQAQQIVQVAQSIVYPGQTVTADLLRPVELKPGKVPPPAVASVPEDLVGKVAKRTLLPGRYIPLNSVREAWIVEPGAAVQVVLQTGALTLSTAAVTLEAGAAGDLIKVRNIDSGKVFSGAVMADGSIRVGAQ